MSIKCCNGCKPPKRNPTCHVTCEEYIKEKKEYDIQKESQRKIQSLSDDLYDQRSRSVNKAMKRNKR